MHWQQQCSQFHSILLFIQFHPLRSSRGSVIKATDLHGPANLGSAPLVPVWVIGGWRQERHLVKTAPCASESPTYLELSASRWRLIQTDQHLAIYPLRGQQYSGEGPDLADCFAIETIGLHSISKGIWSKFFCCP